MSFQDTLYCGHGPKGIYWWIIEPGVITDVCSQIYVGNIEIRFENVAASQISPDHKDEDLVAANEEPRLTSPSPLEVQEVDQIRKKEEQEVPQQEPLFLEGYLKMNEINIQESLSILNETKALVSYSCWKVSSLEDPSFLEKNGEDSKSNVQH